MKPGRGQGFSVLLVEKDPVVSHFLRKTLETNREFPSNVDHVSNLRDALKRVNARSYQLLLFDSDLDQEEGLQFLEEVHRLHQEIPFVFMTAVGDEALRRRVLDGGAVDIIVKSESYLKKLSEILHQLYPAGSPPELSQRRWNPLFLRERSVDRTVQDELTGLYTHSYLHNRIPIEYSRVTRYGYPFSCLMLDIDHFKSINQKHGHQVGDQLLQECAELLFENCRLSDIVARYGGEEFAILLPHVDYAGAYDLASRLRIVFAERVFCADSLKLQLTVSIGISSYPEDTVEHCSEVVFFASRSLFRSKAVGRNCITRYKDILPEFGKELPSLKISENKVIEFQRRLTEIADVARRGYVDASKALIMALENKDRFTAGHAASCARYCMQVAQVLGMSVEEAEIVQHAALLHDIGKICITDDILMKSNRLTFEEYEKMKQHPYLGYKILKPIKFLQEESLLVLHHHEWFNGEGYPHRLKGEQIPLGARIIGVIDSYDTMRVAGGRYRKTVTVEEAVQELIAYAGVQFDPRVVKAFIEVLKSRGELTTENYDKEPLEKALRALST